MPGTSAAQSSDAAPVPSGFDRGLTEWHLGLLIRQRPGLGPMWCMIQFVRNSKGIPPEARTLRAFLIELWCRPGARFMLVSVCLGGYLVLRNGVMNLVVTLVVALSIGGMLGFRRFRRAGPV